MATVEVFRGSQPNLSPESSPNKGNHNYNTLIAPLVIGLALAELAISTGLFARKISYSDLRAKERRELNGKPPTRKDNKINKGGKKVAQRLYELRDDPAAFSPEGQAASARE